MKSMTFFYGAGLLVGTAVLIGCAASEPSADHAAAYAEDTHDVTRKHVRIAANDSQAEAFWLLRDSISPAERAIGPAMQHDISVPVSRMADFVAAALPAVEQRFPGSSALAFGHLGDGNVHFHVLAPGDATPGEWEDGEGKHISAFVHDLVTEWGGSISAEHGIGQMKRDELGRLGDPVSLALMRSVKQALDPRGLFNPGKLLPLAQTGVKP